MRYLSMYLISFAIFLVSDLIWLNRIAKRLYRRELGHLLAEKFRKGPAFIFYVLFVAGLLYFCIYPAYTATSLSQALFTGAFFGLVTYATYDLTNMATIRDWPLLITVTDMIWGSVLGGTTSTIAYLIFRLLF